MKTISINGRSIGYNKEPFIIAEVGINHNGDVEIAKKMIQVAKDSGVDAVKFQTFHAKEFISNDKETYTYISQGVETTESMLKMFERHEFSRTEWKQIKDFCDEQQITFLSTPQNETDLDILLPLGIEAIKIGSDDFINIPLVKSYSSKGLPLLLSCGMADEDEIDMTLQAAGYPDNKEICVLLCTSEYPTPAKDVNARKILTLVQKYPDLVIGFSDHSQGNTAAIAAVALGARIFEKHFTLDHNMIGPDHWFSADPGELREWVNGIRTGFLNLGSASLKPTAKEQEMRKIARRSITVIKSIKKGEILSDDNMGLRRPGTGLPPSEWESFIGKTAARSMEVDYQPNYEDIE